MRRASKTSRSTRDLILEAAVTVLLDCGFEASSMEAVAKAAGVSRRTLFNQFDSKQELFCDAVEHVWSRTPIIEITTHPESISNPKDTLIDIGRTIANFWAPPEAIALARMVIREGPRFPSLVKNYLTLGKVPKQAILANYLRRLDKEGKLEIPDPELAAKQFNGLINEPLVWMRILGLEEAPSEEYRRRVVNEAVAMFLARYGLQTSRAPQPKAAEQLGVAKKQKHGRKRPS